MVYDVATHIVKDHQREITMMIFRMQLHGAELALNAVQERQKERERERESALLKYANRAAYTMTKAKQNSHTLTY